MDSVPVEAAKTYRDSTHRLVPPKETLARVEPFLPVMGITRIANVTGLDTIGVPVVMVTRPNSRSISVSQGKGYDLAAAKASGVMESIESYHAERMNLPLKLGSFEDLRYTHALVDVDRLPRLSDSRFSPYERILWVEGQNLMGGDMLWVPYEMVHLDYTLPLPSGHGCFMSNSNGLASGNHRLEALNHAIGEVIERDATTLWHRLSPEAQEATRLDLDSIHDPACRDLLDRFERAGVLVALWETTSDIGVPSFLCRILEDSGPATNTVRPAAGMGCHVTREVALVRALSEAAQSRLTFISGARDDMDRQGYELFLDPATYDSWRSAMVPRGRGRSFNDVPSFHHRTFEEDLALQLDRLRSAGVDQVVAVDLTKPEFGIPVARVVIPGLEGIDSSRKYQAGARARALLERRA